MKRRVLSKTTPFHIYIYIYILKRDLNGVVLNDTIHRLPSPPNLQQKKEKKYKLFLLPRCNVRGEEDSEQCRSKQHRSVSFFFFFMHETASFWTKRAVSLKQGANTRQTSNQPSIIFNSFQLYPCQFGPRPSCWPRFSLWSLASDFHN